MRSGLVRGRHVAFGMAIAVVVALSGCASVPPAELHAYTDAFSSSTGCRRRDLPRDDPGTAGWRCRAGRRLTGLAWTRGL